MTKLLVGGYTPAKGHGTGIGLVDDAAIDRIVPASSPSWIARHPRLPVLYAVAETEAGGVAAWTLVDGVPASPLGTGETGGADPCHLTVDASGRFLVTVNYTGGSVAVHRLGDDGRILERTDLVRHERRGDHVRQDGPHPHMVRADGDGLLVTDLGGDAIYRYHLDAGTLVRDRIIEVPRGCGPRHLRPVGDRWIVTAELSAQILIYDTDWHLLGAVATTTSTVECLPSELVATDDFLYVANRGPDTVAVFALGADLPKYVIEVPTGKWPRHIALDGDLLHVANELSDEVTTMRIVAGVPSMIGRIAIPSPTCVLTC